MASPGGYRVQKVGPRQGQVLTTEGLLVDRQRKNFESLYHTCCAHESFPDSSTTDLLTLARRGV